MSIKDHERIVTLRAKICCTVQIRILFKNGKKVTHFLHVIIFTSFTSYYQVKIYVGYCCERTAKNGLNFVFETAQGCFVALTAESFVEKDDLCIYVLVRLKY